VVIRDRNASQAITQPLLLRVREYCLALPETSETASWGHPNFRAGKRTFVTFEECGGVACIAFYAHPFDVERLEKEPGFSRTPYGKGRWVGMTVRPQPRWALVESLVLKSYKLVALKRMLERLERTAA
jgi:predicted DNA-binding protein (MmcQ/YjbR family)